MRALIVVALLALPLSAAALSAQQTRVGVLQGTIRERVASRSVSAAWVSLLPLQPQIDTTFNIKPDARGRYQIDSLPAGRYLVQVGSPTLDSLNAAMPPDELIIFGGKTARADFVLPAGARLRDAVCHGLTLRRDQVAVAGHAIDADTEKPVAGASVVATWTEVSFDKATLKTTQHRRATVVTTGPLGEYRMCGLPEGRWLSMQLQHAGRAGAVLRASVSAAEGAIVRNISLSVRSSPTVAVLDSLERTIVYGSAGVERPELQLSGTAVVRGIVRTTSGQPVANATVRVRDAASSTVTDGVGRFTIGALPAGTQVLIVRQIGFSMAELPVELRSGKITGAEVKLVRAAALDTVNVVSSGIPYAEFEYNKRTNLSGWFLNLGQIQRRDAKETAELLQGFGAFTVQGRGARAMVTSRRASGDFLKCAVNVVIDGLEGMHINDVQPIQIGAIEAYTEVPLASRYHGRADCGLIVIWTRPRRNTPKKPDGDGGDASKPGLYGY